MIGWKPDICMSQIPQTVERNSPSRQQGKREGKLDDDQATPQDVPPEDQGSSALLKNFVQIQASCLPSGSATEQNPRQHGRSKREQQDG
jgi:hypothetical protein